MYWKNGDLSPRCPLFKKGNKQFDQEKLLHSENDSKSPQYNCSSNAFQDIDNDLNANSKNGIETHLNVLMPPNQLLLIGQLLLVL